MNDYLYKLEVLNSTFVIFYFILIEIIILFLFYSVLIEG